MNFAGLQRIGYKTTLGGSYTYLTGKIGANSFLQQESVEERTASDSLDKELRFNAELVLYDRSNYDQLYVLMDNDTEVYFIFEFPNRQVETLSTKIIVEDRINLSARSRSYLLLRFRFWIYVGAGGFNTGTEPFSPPPFVDPEITDDIENADIFVVAGGGQGGWQPGNPSFRPHAGGGGGAGGVLFRKNVTIDAGIISFQVGRGGGTEDEETGNILPPQGENSYFNDYLAIGGGPGGGTSSTAGSGGAGGGGRHFFQSTGQTPGLGTAGQGSHGESGGGGGFPTHAGRGGGADNIYDSNFDFYDELGDPVLRSFLNGDGVDFASVFGPYFASNYGWDNPDDPGKTNAYFGAGGGPGFIGDGTGDGSENDAGIGGGGSGGYVPDSIDWNNEPVGGNDAINGTGSGGGGVAGKNATSFDAGSGGSGFVMFRVPIADAGKVTGSFLDVFDYDGYRHYVLGGEGDPTVDPPPDPEPPPEPPPEPETPEYFGSIEITSPSASATPAIRPSAVTTLQNNPSPSSDDCGGAGTNKTEVSYKGSDYCWQMLATVNKSVNATILVNHINANVPGLRATNQGGFNPRILLEGNPGVADNNESVVFLVPVAIEGNGAIFSPSTVDLTGGKDSETVNEPVQIFIGGLLFATSANVTDEEPAEDIAIKIFNALDGVSQSNYTFTRNGAKITVESNRGQTETINLVSNAGFSFLTENIDIVP